MPRLVRDVVLFVAGLVLIFEEAARSGEPRFYLLLLYAAMIGLPAFLGTDDLTLVIERLRRRNGNAPPVPEPPRPPEPPALSCIWVPV